MGAWYGTARSMRMIAIQPVRLQLQQKDHSRQSETYVVQPIIQPMIPGVESQKRA